MTRPAIEYLLSRVLRGDASDKEREAVRLWRESSPENERYFRELSNIIDVAGGAEGGIRVEAPPPVRDLVLLAEARNTVSKHAPRAAPGSGGRVIWSLVVAAAAVFLVIGGVALYLLANNRDSSLSVETIATGASEPLTVRLSDGSVIRMAPMSQLRILPGAGARIVDLEGRAYFAIAHYADRPFILRSRAGDAKVLGTRFQAETSEGSMSVVVIEGRVALSGKSHEAEIGASQQGRIVNGVVTPVVPVSDPSKVLEWMGDFVAFQATPLLTAIREIAEKHDMRYEIADDVPLERDLTMWFSDRSVDVMVDVICVVIGIKCAVEGDLIRLGV